MKKNGITEYFAKVETVQEYTGYLYSVGDAITILILGSMCGLRDIKHIHQWAVDDRVCEFLKEEFGIEHIPCYCPGN